MSRLRIALIASVILNLFLAAALVAGYTSLRTGKRMLNAGSLRIAGAELPASERRPFRQALRQTRWAMRPTIDISRTAKVEAAELLRQDAVDQTAVLVALDRARSADMAVRAAVERRAVAFAAGLPADDRARLAGAMERRAGRSAPSGE
ncbi:periplasmic heavy metal sensor [Sphingomonas sp. 1P08PE]|uniref:periplasmic heavy metal sensor n=1 Tax=Sphingomonas sp. 1P08PE TaxID=554122 RepID=UPI00399EF50D